MQLNVIIGSTIETYTKGLKFFEKLEKKFKCKVLKKNYYIYQTKINNSEIKFLFTYKPKRDKNYLDSFEKWKKKGKKIPPSL